MFLRIYWVKDRVNHFRGSDALGCRLLSAPGPARQKALTSMYLANGEAVMDRIFISELKIEHVRHLRDIRIPLSGDKRLKSELESRHAAE